MKKNILFVKTILILIIIGLSGKLVSQPKVYVPVKGKTDDVFYKKAIISNDDKIVMALSYQDNLEIWDFKTGDLIRVFKDEEFSEYDIIGLNPNGKEITTFNDSIVSFWDVKTGKIFRKFAFKERGFEEIKYSEDGNKIVFLSGEKITLYDNNKNKIILRFDTKSGRIRSYGFNKKGELIVTYKENQELIVKNIYSGKKFSIGKNFGKVKLYTQSGILIAFKYDVFEFWDIETGKLKSKFYPKSGGSLVDFVFIPEKQLLVTLQWSSIIFWDLRKKRAIKTIKRFLSPRYISINTYKFDLSPDNNKIFISSPGNAGSFLINFEDINNIKIFKNLSGYRNEKPFNKTGSLAVCRKSKEINFYDTSSGDLVRSIKTHTSPVDDLYLSFDERVLEILDYHNSITCFDLEKGKPIGSFPFKVGSNKLKSKFLSFDNSKIITYIFTDKSEYYTKLVIKDVFKNKELFKTRHNSYYTSTASFSTDGKYIVISDEFNKKIEIRNSNDLSLFKKIFLNSADNVSAILDDSNSRLLALIENNIIELIDVKTGKVILKEKFDYEVVKAEFIQDNSKILVETKGGKYEINIKTKKIEESYYMLSSIIKLRDNKKMILDNYEYDPESCGNYGMYDNNQGLPKEPVCFYNIIVLDSSTSDTLKQYKFDSCDMHYKVFPNGNKIMLYNKEFAQVYDLIAGDFVCEIKWDNKNIKFKNILFSKNMIIISGYDHSIRFWDSDTGVELFAYYPLDENDWLLMHPSGLFDASERAFNKIYVRTGGKLVKLGELKHRFYYPDLWKKVMNNELDKYPDYNEINVKRLPFHQIKLISKFKYNAMSEK